MLRERRVADGHYRRVRVGWEGNAIERRRERGEHGPLGLESDGGPAMRAVTHEQEQVLTIDTNITQLLDSRIYPEPAQIRAWCPQEALLWGEGGGLGPPIGREVGGGKRA